MPETYEPINTQTLSGFTSSVNFSSIPQTYTDLILICMTVFAIDSVSIDIRFNGDTTTNYSATRIVGNGTSVSSDRFSTTNIMRIGTGYSTLTATSAHIFNYTNATTQKTVLSRSGNASNETTSTVGLWRKTPEAITSISVFNTGSASFGATSSFTLYGIRST